VVMQEDGAADDADASDDDVAATPTRGAPRP